MTDYDRMYRLGFTPWERYLTRAGGSVSRFLDRETADRPPGRALDLGCGRGLYGAELSRRGWRVVGVDAVPRAVEAARARATRGERYVVADVTDLPADLGTFDLFLDVGCLQGLDATQRAAYGRQVSALADDGSTMLSLQFGDSRYRKHVGGVTQDEITESLPAWELLTTDDAETRGLGWPMNRTSPTWYRFQFRSRRS